MTIAGHHEREMLSFRRRNSAACLGVLRDHGVLTLAALSRLTGLSRPTIESIVGEQAIAGLVREEAEPASTGSRAGRPARRFSFNASAAFAASVDLGLHRVTALISDLSGEIIGFAQRDLPPAIAGGDLVAAMSAVLHDALVSCDLGESQLAAVVVCVSGIVDDHGRVLQSNVLPEWNGVDLAARFSSGLDCPVVVENDVNMAAVGEMHAGAARQADDVVFVMVGHRISAAIILNGALHRGRNFAAGEVGDLAPTGWGYEDVREISVLGAFLGRSPEDVFAAAEAGDPEANSLVRQFAHRIVRGIAVVGLTVDPDLIVIGGGLSAAGDVLLDAISIEFDALVNRRLRPAMVSSSIGMNGVALGGLVRALELVSERLYGSSDVTVPPLRVAGLSAEQALAPLGSQLLALTGNRIRHDGKVPA